MFPPPVLSSSRKQKQVTSEATGRVCVSHSLHGVSWRATDVFFPRSTQALLIMLLLAQISSGAPSHRVRGGRKERKACDFELRIEATILDNLKILLRAVCWFSEEWQDPFQKAPGNLQEAAGIWKLGALHPKVITLNPGLHSALPQCL